MSNRCGIAAGLMLTDTNEDNLLERTNQMVLHGRRLGLTTYGEMFYAQDLADLIQTHLNIPASVVHPFDAKLDILLAHLLERSPVLIPYDYCAQFTELPSRNGEKAHWAVIVGFYYIFNSLDSLSDSQKDEWKNLEEGFQTNSITTEQKIKWILDYNFDRESLYFYARHSKTNRACVWKLNDLLSNNQNLKNVAPKYNKPETKFKIPPNGDLSQCLSNRFILIDKQFESWQDYFCNKN